MTLILALVGRDNAVLAADGQLTQGSSGGYYASSVQKLRLVNRGNWILGVAISQVGYDLAKYIEENDEGFPENIRHPADSDVGDYQEMAGQPSRKTTLDRTKNRVGLAY